MKKSSRLHVCNSRQSVTIPSDNTRYLRETEREREIEKVCVCVCERERERERLRDRER